MLLGELLKDVKDSVYAKTKDWQEKDEGQDKEYIRIEKDVYEKGGRWYCTIAAWPYSPAARGGAKLETKDSALTDFLEDLTEGSDPVIDAKDASPGEVIEFESKNSPGSMLQGVVKFVGSDFLVVKTEQGKQHTVSKQGGRYVAQDGILETLSELAEGSDPQMDAKDDNKEMSISQLQQLAKEGRMEMSGDPKVGYHVEVTWHPSNKKEMVYVVKDAATGTPAEQELIKDLDNQIAAAKRNGDSEEVKELQERLAEVKAKIAYETGDADIVPYTLNIGDVVEVNTKSGGKFKGKVEQAGNINVRVKDPNSGKGTVVYYSKGKYYSYDSKVGDSSDYDKKMSAKGYKYKIQLPPGQGEDLYAKDFTSAKEMAKEYGAGTKVTELTADCKVGDAMLVGEYKGFKIYRMGAKSLKAINASGKTLLDERYGGGDMVELRKKIDLEARNSSDCKVGDITFGGKGYRCAKCGDTATAAHLIKHRSQDATNYMGEKEYRTYEGWKAACRAMNANVQFEGDKEICNAKPGIGEWDGEKGIIYTNDKYTGDPLNEKGKEILAAMIKEYGEEKGKEVFYASKNKGTITGVDTKE